MRGLVSSLIVVVALGLFLGSSAAQARTLKVVASFTVLADMTRAIGGDKVEVVSLVGPSGDPHSFEPTPRDAERLKHADLVVVNGLGLEGWMDRLIVASGYKGRAVVASNGIAALETGGNGKAALDPHAWNSAANAIVYAKAIAGALSATDPDDAKRFEAAAEDYEAKIGALDAQARQEVASLPVTSRKVLTTHGGLGYFAKAYGVEILSPLGISTQQDPSAQTMAALIRQIKRERIRTYFIESSSDPRLIEQIARATGARPGGDLYVESLSKPSGPASTYLAMFRYNLGLMVKAMRQQS